MGWYKTYNNDALPPRCIAVSHFESPDGVDWLFSDGRPMKSVPVCLEDGAHVVYTASGSVRPSNPAVLPDGRPVLIIWDDVAGTQTLGVRQKDRTWKLTDLSAAVARYCPGTHFVEPAQITTVPPGEIIAVISRAEERKWGHPSTTLHSFHIAPDTGEILSHVAFPKTQPEHPDWLASIEKGVLGRNSDTPCCLYTSGPRGYSNINDVRSRVMLIQLE